MFRSILVVCSLICCVSCQLTPSGVSPEAPNLFCDLCNSGLSLVQNQLVVLESVTKNDLGSVVEKVCRAAPTDIPIVRALCVVLKENLVNALVTLVQGIKEQTNPRLLCGYLKVCDSDFRF